jgi:predicted nuclease of predicted toxin-antitoxin system
VRVLVDENIPALTVRALREMGHDVRDVRGTAGEGMSDEELWGLAQRERRLLITTDKGLASRRYESHAGLLVVRLRQPNRARIHERVLWAIARFEPAEWPDRLIVLRDMAVTRWPGDHEAER